MKVSSSFDKRVSDIMVNGDQPYTSANAHPFTPGRALAQSPARTESVVGPPGQGRLGPFGLETARPPHQTPSKGQAGNALTGDGRLSRE